METSEKLAGFEGVRPKNAVCLECGYLFGGVAIVGGVVVCPECGRENRFELNVVRKDWPERVRKWMNVFGWGMLILAGLLVLRAGGWKWVVLFVVIALPVTWVSRRLMRWWMERWM